MSLCRQQAFIDAPPEVVWNLLSDIDRHAEWWRGFVEVECDRLETGCEYRQVVTDPFGKDTAETFSLRGLLPLPLQWAILDSNQGPRPYQRRALTN